MKRDKISKQINEIDITISRNVKWLVLSLLLVGLLIGSAIASSVSIPAYEFLQTIAAFIFVAGAAISAIIIITFVWRWLNRGEL